MINLIKKYYLFCKKHTNLILFNCILVALIFGSRIFTMNITIDTDIMITYPSTTYNWLDIGRWGLILFQKIFGMRWFNPYVECSMAYVAIVLFLVSYCFLFDNLKNKDKNLNYYVFCGLMITHPIFALQWFFRLQAFEIALSISFIAFALICIFEWIDTKDVSTLICSVILMIISFSCYQTNVILYISGAVFGYFLKYEKNYNFKKNFMICLKLVTTFIIAFLTNEIISRLFFINSSYVSNSILWDKDNLMGNFWNIYSHIKEVLFGSQVMTCVFLIIIILYLFLFVFDIKSMTKAKLFKWFILGCFLVSPFLLSIYMGANPLYRSQYTLPFVISSSFMLFITLYQERLHFSFKFISINKLIKICLIVIASFTIISQSQTTLRMWYTEDVRYQQDRDMLLSIIDDLQEENYDYKNKPVVFIGSWQGELNPACFKPEIEMLGISYFTMLSEAEPYYFHSTAGIKRLAVCNGINMMAASQENCIEAIKREKELTAWPQRGYIKEYDDMIIIKLSNELLKKDK